MGEKKRRRRRKEDRPTDSFHLLHILANHLVIGVSMSICEGGKNSADPAVVTACESADSDWAGKKEEEESLTQSIMYYVY